MNLFALRVGQLSFFASFYGIILYFDPLSSCVFCSFFVPFEFALAEFLLLYFFVLEMKVQVDATYYLTNTQLHPS